MNRGEKLDDLVYKSEELGTQSKAFYKTVSVFLFTDHFHKIIFSGQKNQLMLRDIMKLWKHVIPNLRYILLMFIRIV